MTALEKYRDHYEDICSLRDDKYTKYEWASSYIFDLYTYDAALDEIFVKDIIEVCKVIIDKTNYDYIKDDNNYIKYVLVCQILYRFNWINWGTSIRGAWFEDDSRKDILEESSWSQVNEKTGEWDHYKIESVPFSIDNLKALIEFMEEDTDSE